ncbi:MAG: serine/threonine protein kinase [Planctomycetes bacterium]|nr:serine/threonine protein kinase [Planctomycetota bacterium]
MNESRSWFDDEAVFESAIRGVLTAPRGAPAIPGYAGLRELAHGGQGVVYAATQLSTRRTVAIKVLRDLATEGSGGGDQGLRRFEREVGLAASLRHPNVVALHDSGTLADGRPYLVMELIDGPSIEHAPAVLEAREHGMLRPWLDALLRTFAAACDGVAYAHRRGVVHRDLKPSNIRVDPDGVPKVLDFGLAKDLSGAAELPSLTIGGTGATFLGSLPWASPEQALGRSRDIDVRSDVYALGVVLFQLVSGRFPYDVESDLRTALDSIVQSPPLRLRRLVPAVDTDLETIVQLCLQKDPDRRYQSAADLARDLRHYVEGQTIEARRDSAWYLLRATARRHRGVVVAALLVVASLVVGLLAALVQWRRAEEGRQVALAQARRADAAMTFFADTLVAVDPDRDGGDVRVLDLVKRAAPDLKHRFDDDPDTQQYFYTKLVELLRNLGATQDAEGLAAEALATARERLGEDHPSTVFCHANHALLLHRLGRSAEAVAELEPAAELVRARPDRYRSAARHVFGNLGSALLALNRIDDAEAAFRDAVRYGSPQSDPADVTAANNETLAAIAGYRGDYAEAVRLLRIAIPIREEAFGREHSSTLRARGNLAFYLAESGALEEALAIMDDDLAICRRRFGDRGTQTLSALNNRGSYRERLGRLDDAQRDYQECLEGRLEVLGEEHPHTLVTMGNVASLAMRTKDYDIAERWLTRAIEIGTRMHGDAHPDVLIQRNNLAHVHAAHGDPTAAIAELRAVLAAAREGIGEEHLQTAMFRASLGRYLLGAGDREEAIPMLEHALRVMTKVLGPDSEAARGVRALLDAPADGGGR